MSCKLQDLQIVAFWLGNALQSVNLYELVTFGTLYHYIILFPEELPWRWGGVGVEMERSVAMESFFAFWCHFRAFSIFIVFSLATSLILFGFSCKFANLFSSATISLASFPGLCAAKRTKGSFKAYRHLLRSKAFYSF